MNESPRPIEYDLSAETHTQFSREVTVRYRGQPLACGQASDPINAAALVRKIIRDDSKEHFVALHLDTKHRCIGHSVVSVGTAKQSLVHPREVFQPAILVGAVGIIVAHNHPSGDTTPSLEDSTVTQQLAEAGRLLGIRLLDHLVVSRQGKFYSFSEHRPELLL